jgi:xylulokinase
MSLYMGLDLSTTGAKALILDEAGRVLASHSTPLSLSTPRPLWSEQDPYQWWQAMREAILASLGQFGNAEMISAIGLTGQMHGLVCLDAQGRVLRPAILWNDQRTAEECTLITEKIGAERLIQLTGNRALTGFTAPKLLWIKRHEPDIYAQIAHILLPKDYIRYRLTGAFATDMADGGGTLLMDVAGRCWSEDVLAALDIPAAWLPTLYEGTAISAEVSQHAADDCGLRAGTPVVGGGGDQAAQAVGVGAVTAGTIALTLGTSGVVFAPLNAYAYEPEGRLHAFPHAAPQLWHFMGVMLSAAGSLQWYRDTFAPNAHFEDLLAEASSIPALCEGLFFLPYLSGERTPHPDPLARGAFLGLTTRHTRAHLTRAVLEGVSFGLRDSFELLKATLGASAVREIRLSGGGAKSPIWRHILADVLNAPLTEVEALEGAAYGAALLAGVGAGHWPDVQAAAGVVVTGETLVPDPENASRYVQGYAVYRDLYPTLQGLFPRLAEL